MRRTLIPAALPLTVLATGLALLAPGAARAAPTTYTIQPIVKLGDQVAGFTIEAASDGGDLAVGALNDRGQIAFLTYNAAGAEMLLQYDNGQFTPIVVGGGDAPGGQWASDPSIQLPVRMNQHGDIVFAANATIGGTTSAGTFRWDHQSRKVTLVAFPGMAAVRGLTFQSGTPDFSAINNQDEIAFTARVKNAAGKVHFGVFLGSPDGQIQPVAIPDDPLPDGSKVLAAFAPSLNDAGLVAFVAAPLGASGFSAYLWDKGAITPIVPIGSAAPDGGTFTTVESVRVNNQNRSVLLRAQTNSPQANGLSSLYRWSNGTVTPVAVPGLEMPGGGQFQALLNGTGTISDANQAGQYAFMAQLQDGSTAAYRMDADGTLSLILNSGTATALGTITAIAPPQSSGGIALNSQGQVALPVQIDSGPVTLALLTPVAP